MARWPRPPENIFGGHLPSNDKATNVKDNDDDGETVHDHQREPLPLFEEATKMNDNARKGVQYDLRRNLPSFEEAVNVNDNGRKVVEKDRRGHLPSYEESKKHKSVAAPPLSSAVAAARLKEL
eukprot:3899025-Rhodomonas_salina.1